MKATSPTTTPSGPEASSNDLILGVDHEIWNLSTLGPAQKWPSTLKAFAQTISAIGYPSALLWGADFVLLHNKAWNEAGAFRGQGQPQRQYFPTELTKILEDVVRDGISKEFPSAKLLNQEAAKVSKHGSRASLTSLSVSDTESCIMMQILPKFDPQQSMLMTLEAGDVEGSATDHKAMEDVPLNEHPFFKRFAEMLPSGLAILDQEAQAIFVNQHFYELTTTTTGDDKFTSWPQSIHDDDYDRVMSAYREAFNNKTELRTEFRARGEPHPWRLLLLTPLGSDNLRHVSGDSSGGFICSIVDISSEKLAELNERKAAKQARERKEQQERFIDMISHEIRNPLSAVLHSAEDISEAIESKKNGDQIDVDMIREAVETINLCVTHQKNIVDDVLSFSKLDASLLSLVPRPAQPSRQLASTLKMFQHEFRKEKLQFKFEVDETYDKVDVSWVLADVARISQVLINLVTNAIKFTHNVDRDKHIQCSVGASIERPHSYPPDVVFYQSDNIAHRMDATNSNDWGDGGALYIMVAVRDTGIGISQEGQKRLFERFQQATPKTEEVYGGSGLGLNISRKICHLHGGEIGVSSREGQGSTFGFFFKVRRTDQHPEAKQEDEVERQEEHQMRGKIRALGKQNPDHLDTAEPFEYSRPDSQGPSRNDRGQTQDPGTSDMKEKFTYEHAPPGEGDINVSNENATPKRPAPPRMVSSDISVVNSDAKEPERPISSLNREPSQRAHVLLVEDNIVNQKIIFRKLETKGFNITTANNGQEAVEAVKAAPKLSTGDKKAFDIVLMDQEARHIPKRMPIMDGNAATKAIRKLESEGQLERVPILGVTANARGAQQDEMLESGMDDVISKPYKIDELVEKMNKVTMKVDGKQVSPSR